MSHADLRRKDIIGAVPDRLHIVQVNLAYDPVVVDPAALVDRYHTLTGWSRAVAAAGASVSVVQRFARDARVERDGITYAFRSDQGLAMPDPLWESPPVLEAVRDLDPDLIHINGLMFPGMAAGLRRAVGARAVIVLQDHAGARPPLSRSPVHALRARRWQRAVADVDAWSFTAIEHADPWRAHGLLGEAQVLRIVEASTTLRPMPRAEAQALTGVFAQPALLWVGRLNENKDPLTLLHAFEAAVPSLPNARCWMVYGDATLEREVRQCVMTASALRDRVTLIGHVPHEQMSRYLSAADIFVSASHHEGSGYALIEAMACGLVPVVSDIPSFRAIAGDCGERWRAGDTAACAGALTAAATGDLARQREAVLARFERELTWETLGAQTLQQYETLVRGRRGGTGLP